MGPSTQPDPIGLAGGLNTYGFAAGDPVNFSDPFGLCPHDPSRPCPTWTGARAAAALSMLSNWASNMAVLPSVTVIAGPVQAEFSADGIAVTGSAQMALALTANGTVGRGAGELGTLSVGGLVGTAFVGGMTVHVDAKTRNLEGITYSVGIGVALPAASSMELSEVGAKLLSGVGTVGVGLGEGRSKGGKR